MVLKSETLCKEQSGWRFTENQGVTTINRNSATYMVTTSSLTTEMEAATYALNWIYSVSGTAHYHSHIQWDCYNRLKGKFSLTLINLPSSKTPVAWHVKVKRISAEHHDNKEINVVKPMKFVSLKDFHARVWTIWHNSRWLWYKLNRSKCVGMSLEESATRTTTTKKISAGIYPF